jgi:hypothetical protein
LEDVISSWQRALAKEGLVSGNFYSIYNESAATNIDDEAMKKRLKSKKDVDLERIIERMDKVSIERAYRIIKALDDFSKEMKEEKLPLLKESLQEWGRKVLWTDFAVFILLLVIAGVLQFQFNVLELISSPLSKIVAGGIFALIMILVHLKARSLFSLQISKKWKDKDSSISKAILHNTKWWRTTFGFGRNWHKNTKDKLDVLMAEGKQAIQKLNDQFVSSVSKNNNSETEVN